ncbi:MAG: hypothetical protein IPH06_07095 [Alphaproteobacteria bacterium]|nr:hypothetical protein [Alphaproteobacteria bacterium]QQS57780.1 MAG: hypothetical protein IPN28_02855 [Alphaproteobacteria bacterium]
MIVYKYYSSQYDYSIKAGFFYLNTFENIRRHDSSQLIGDPQEAVATHSVNIDIFSDSPATTARLNAATLGMIQISGSYGTIIRNSNFSSILPNAYMFCVTQVRNDDYWQRVCNYNRCLRIENFIDFSGQISIALSEQQIRHAFSIRECTYNQRTGRVTNQEFEVDTPCYFKKTPAHLDQQECRSVFVPVPAQTQHTLTPINLYLGINGISFIY